jgi:MoxR-like ATPase
MTDTKSGLPWVTDMTDRIIGAIEHAVIGKRHLLEQILAAVLSDGHVLLEDFPGLAKTLIANCIAQAMGLSFRRIQFTPDLLPGDITGGYIFDRAQNKFVLRQGPIFSNVILADEINRASPRTQSALLEAMQERQVTLEGETMRLPQPFIVIATQNPIEYEGTFPLPEAQLDRFMIKLSVGYPTPEEEQELLRRRHRRKSDDIAVGAVTDIRGLHYMRQVVETVHIEPDLERYIVNLTGATRAHQQVAVGASPRGTLSLFKISRAWAAMHGRSYLLPDDVKLFVKPTLNHRLILKPDLWTVPQASERILVEMVKTIAVPVVE